MDIWKEMCEKTEKETHERKLNVLRNLFKAANECINEGLLLNELARFKNDVAKITETENKTEEEDDDKPQSWVQFCTQYPVTPDEYYIKPDSSIESYSAGERSIDRDKNLCSSKEEAEAFLAMIQLRQLRKAWIGNWEPDWSDESGKWVIKSHKNELDVMVVYKCQSPLSFPTEEMAEYFLHCHRILLETAKTLL